MKYVTLHDPLTDLVPRRMRISIVYLFSDKMAEKADPTSTTATSIDPPEPTPPVWRIEREEVPLSRGESRDILAKRLRRKRKKPQGQVHISYVLYYNILYEWKYLMLGLV